jgi:5-methylcytosine-specific restriction protein A
VTKLTSLKPRVQAQALDRLKTVNPESWRNDKTAAQRGYDSKWRRARDSYLRAYPLCVMCRAEGRATAARVVDHIQPHRGDMALFWRRDNWQPLCRPCHSSTKQAQEAKAKRSGWY